MATRQFQRELRHWRTRKGLTQRALADRVRFSRETVAAVEAGRRYGSQELAVRCDDVLGTGGRLGALWPQVAVEQLAADGRRGPRAADTGRPAGPLDLDAVRGDPQAVVDAIDELRDLLDQMLRTHLAPDQPGHPEAGQQQEAETDQSAAEDQRRPAEPRRPSGEARRGYTESHRRGGGRVGASVRRH